MSIVSTLIAPYRAYLIAGALVLVMVGIGRFAAHERSVEHAKDVAVATQAVARVEKQDAKIESTANARIQHDQLIYKQIISMPPVGDLGIVCSSPGGDTVSGAAGRDGSGQGPGGPREGYVFDPSGDLLTKSRSYGAIIRALQSENATLRAEMLAANKVHR